MIDYGKILRTIDALKAADKAGKKRILNEADSEFRTFIAMCLDPQYSFKVSRIKKSVDTEPGDPLDFLLRLDKKPAATKGDKEKLARMASQSDECFEVVNKILRRNMDCGVAEKLVREALPGLLTYSPYCRCSLDMARIDFSKGAYSQLKADGMFFNIKKLPGGNYTFTTRNGRVANFPVLPDPETCKLMETGWVSMGEAMVLQPGGLGFLPRAQGNAIITKALFDNISIEETKRIYFSLWDMVPILDFSIGKCNMSYDTRHELLEVLFRDRPGALIESRIVYSREEAQAHYDEVRAREEEGTVVKDKSALWRDSTSQLQVKVKSEKECEVRIVGWIEGKPGSKYEGKIGSLRFESECSKLFGSCSGMSDEIRELDPEEMIGKIITVKFNEVSTNKNREERSFDHARFVDFRPDKDVADTLDYILKLK